MNRLSPEQPLHRSLTAFLVVLSLVPSPLLLANPGGEIVVHGDVQFDRSAGQLRVLQASDRAIIDWESFSIGAGELTEFVQPNSSSAALNRVRGASASQIEGMLRANGKVYILNPNGILIGPNGSIDVGGFAGSTLDISNEQFRNGGDLNFAGASQAAIVNLGSISALDGDVILIAASVSNEGTIKAPNGTAALAAGNDVLLAESGSERVFVRGASGENKAVGVNNSGSIEANIAELKSYGGNIYGMAVKNEGRVAATGVTRQGGQIFLSAKGGKVRSTGTLKARKSDGSGGSVKVDSGNDSRTEIGGKIDTSGDSGQGGEIIILGREIEVFEGSLIMNDGETGGGNTYVGGSLRNEDPEFMNAENVFVGEGARFSSSALDSGDGGTVVVFAEDSLVFNGHVSSRGGNNSGNGGFVELSGKRSLTIPSLSNSIDLAASYGDAGTLLLDPVNISILAGSGPVIANTFYADDISTTLAGANLTITTNSVGVDPGNIDVAGGVSISWSSDKVLALVADNDITFQAGALISATGSGAFSATAARSIKLGNVSTIQTENGALTLSANAAGTTTGNFVGVDVNGALVQALGTGAVSITGTGGNDAAGLQYGVHIHNGGDIIGGTGPLSVTGFGGSSPSSGNIGVRVSGFGSTISSLGGTVVVEGTGGGGANSGTNYGVSVDTSALIGNAGSGIGSTVTVRGYGSTIATYSSNHGVLVFSSGSITSSGGAVLVEGTGGGTGTSPHNYGVYVPFAGSITSSGTGSGATVTVNGIGGNAGGSGATNYGIHINGLNSRITSSGGAISLTGVGTINSEAVLLQDSGAITSGSNANVTITADSLHIITSGSIHSGSGTTTILTRTPGSFINLGGSDVLSGSPLTLGLSDAELDRITAGTLQIGNNTSGTVTVSAAITYANHLSLTTGAGITFNDAVTLTADKNFTGASTGTITFGHTNADLATTGTGAILLTTQQDILMITTGSSITSVDGDITLNANQQLIQSTGSFYGIQASNVLIGATGSGNISISGRAGIGGTSTVGIAIDPGATVRTNTGNITIVGTGGTNSGDQNNGMQVHGGSIVESIGGGSIDITGNAGSRGMGVRVVFDGKVRTTGTGNITLTGTGGAGAPSLNHGVVIDTGTVGTGTAVANNGTGTITINGTAGMGGAGFFTGGGGTNRLGFDGVNTYSGNIVINADSMSITDANIQTTANVSLVQKTNGFAINLGGSDSPTSLGLSDPELDQITASTLQIGNANTGAITVSSTITHGNHLSITSGAGVSGSGNITLNAARNFSVSAGGAINLTGVLTVPGSTSFSTGAFGITANNAANNFGGAVSLANNGANAVEIRDANSLVLGTVNAGGDLSVTTAGNLTQTGVITAAGTTTLSAGPTNHITLTNASNDFALVAIGSGGNVGLADVNELTLNASTVTGTFNVSAAGITVAGALGLGDNTTFDSTSGIIFSDAVMMAADKDFEANATGLIDLSHANADISTTGTGAISLTTSRNINLSAGSSLLVENGDLTLAANQQPLASSGNFVGINVEDATIQSTGTGSILLLGKGGDSSVPFNDGISIREGALLSVMDGNLAISGSTGNGTGIGVNVFAIGADSPQLEVAGIGSITITGTGSTGLDGVNLDTGSNLIGGSNADFIEIVSHGGGLILKSEITAGGNVSLDSVADVQIQGAVGSTTGDITITGNEITVDAIVTATAGALAFHLNDMGPGNGGTVYVNAFLTAADGVTYTGGTGDEDTVTFAGFSGGPVAISLDNLSSIESLVGSGDVADQLTGPTAGSLFSFDAADSFSIGSLAVSAFENVTGGAGNDIFSFGSGSSLSGFLDGGGGSENELNYSAFGSDVSVNFANSATTAVTGGFLQINRFVGSGGGGDSFTGPNAIESYLFTGADDFNFGSGANTVVNFANLTGGTGIDTFVFENGSTLTGNLAGGGTENQLDLSAYTTAVSVNFQNNTATGIGGTFSGIDDFVGNGANSTFTGLTVATIYNLSGSNNFTFGSVTVSDFANLSGGDNDDTFIFEDGASLTGNLAGGGTANQLDLSAYSTAVSVNFQTNTATGIGGTFSGIDDFVGSGALSTFTGLTTATIYNLSGSNSFTFGSVTVGDFANLSGGDNDDTFIFEDGATLTGNLAGGGTVNQLDLSAYTTAVSVNFQNNTATGIGGTFSGIDDFIGNGTNSTFTGLTTATIYNLSGSNNFAFGSVTVSDFANLSGGENNDTFIFEDGASLTGNLAGGGTVNQLDLSANSTAVTVNFQTNTATGIGGTFSGIDDFIGNGTNSTFTGLTTATTYNLSGTNGFTFGSVTVTDFANLTGGESDDTFLFADGAVLEGNLVGGGSANQIDLSAYTTAVSVNFQDATSTGINGTFSGIDHFIGNGTNSTFTGLTAATTYNLSSTNDFTFGSVTVTDFANLTGGANDDIFSFAAGSSLTGTLNGGGGTANELRYTGYGSNVSVNFEASTASAIGNGFANITRFTGSGQSGDSFTGTNTGTVYNFTGINAFNTTLFEVIAFENLNGGSSADQFLVSTSAGLTGQLNGGGGVNTLDYSSHGGPVSVNIGSGAATGFGGFSNVTNFVGSAAQDTFIATAAGDVVNITSNNAGTVNGTNTFASFEILNGGSGNDFFNFLNQATVAMVDGGANYDTLFLDDSNLTGNHTYTITSSSISRNPVYNFTNIEHVSLLAGEGDDTINSAFFPFSQTLDAGLGFNTLNLPGVTNLDGTTQIQNVSHLRFAAPRTLTSNPGEGNTPPPPAEFVAQNRFNNGTSDQMMQQLMGNLGGFGATTVIGQGAIIAIEGNSYLIFRAISLDGSGLNPSDAAAAALSENLSVDANVELAGAIGYTGIVLLFMRDGAYCIDLSGAVVDPAVLNLLQSNLGTTAAIELFTALEMPFVISIIQADGAVTIDFDGNAPGQPVIVLLDEQLSDTAFNELSAAISNGN